MKKRGRLLLVVTILFLVVTVLSTGAVFYSSAQAAEGKSLSTLYTVMHPDIETLKKWMRDYENAPRAPINRGLNAQVNATTSLSLLNHLQYTPSERNQAACGNCWMWAGTGIAGIDLDVHKGIKDRLSVQFISSCDTAKTCCGGGWLSDFTAFYNSKKFMIPWSNSNASWQNGDGTCHGTCSSIGTTPYYPVTSMTAQTITTHGVGQATAIANIKNILNQNKAVWFAFYLANDSDWSNFKTYWHNQNESAVWNPDFSCGHTWVTGQGGGHAVLCVGYYDDGGSNRYWIILNSWGTPGGRPNGLFRLAMNMNYDCTFDDGGTNYLSFSWQTLAINWGAMGSSASVTSLWPVTGAQCGGNSVLWAQVKNTGSSSLPSDARVYFYATGPNWSGSNWVGYTSVAGLGAGSTNWYSYNWAIPAASTAGTYTYYAQIWQGSNAISPWSTAQNFVVTCGASASVTSLYQVTGAQCGHTSVLWAQVKNTGSSSLPSDARVYFYATGPNWSGSNWVGFTSVAGLGAGSTNWYSYNWAIPAAATAGSYTYYAQVWKGSSAISPWSAAQAFTVACGSSCGFNETFSSSATNWVAAHGTWNVSGGWYSCTGTGDVHYSSYYDATYSDFQFDAMIWRDAGSSDGCENSLYVRGNPSSLDSKYDWKNAYDFGISRNGNYHIWVGVNGFWTMLQDWTASSYIKTGSAWNKLSVWMKGSDLWFGINGHWVWHGTNTTFSSGKVGVSYYANCGGTFWVDYAKVTCLTGSSTAAPGDISKEQQVLNAAANAGSNGGVEKRGINSKNQAW